MRARRPRAAAPISGPVRTQTARDDPGGPARSRAATGSRSPPERRRRRPAPKPSATEPATTASWTSRRLATEATRPANQRPGPAAYRVGGLGGGVAGHRLDRPARRLGLEAAPATTYARPALRLDHQVPDVPGIAPRAVEESAVDYDASAHPGRNHHGHVVGRTPGRTPTIPRPGPGPWRRCRRPPEARVAVQAFTQREPTPARDIERADRSPPPGPWAHHIPPRRRSGSRGATDQTSVTTIDQRLEDDLGVGRRRGRQSGPRPAWCQIRRRPPPPSWSRRCPRPAPPGPRRPTGPRTPPVGVGPRAGRRSTVGQSFRSDDPVSRHDGTDHGSSPADRGPDC